MIILHCYRKSDGVLTGASFGADDPLAIAANENEEFGLIGGVVDWRTQRVDLSTKQLIDYIPPPPDRDHSWDPDLKAHALKPEVAARRAKHHRAMTRILELDQKRIRALSEYLLGIDGPAAKARLHNIEIELTALRKDLIR